MSSSIDQLREGVSSLTEAFTEVEADMDASVYGAMQPALQKIQDNLATAAVNLDNFAHVQRILTAMSQSDGAIPGQFVNMIIDHLPPREPVRAAPAPRRRAEPRRAEVQVDAVTANPAARIQRPADPFQDAFVPANATMPQTGAEAVAERVRGLRAMTIPGMMVDDLDQQAQEGL